MANTIINPAWVLMETTMRLVNNLRFGNNVDRSYSNEYVQAGAKMGSTVKARLPQRYLRTRGAAMQTQDATDQTIDITLTDQVHVGIDFDSWAETLHVDRYKERYIAPATDELVNGFDFDGMQRMYQETANNVGTPALVPGSTGVLPQAATQTYLDASTRLHDAGVPEDDRRAVISPTMHNYLVGGVMTLFNPAMALSKQYKTGQFAAEALGISKWFMGQNVAVHTVGTLGGTPLINDTVANGATSVICDGATASITGFWKKGDVVQFAGAYAINPLNRQALTYLKDFVITADAASDGSGNVTAPIWPAIYGPGHQLQTVSALPANNAAVTTFGHASSHTAKLTPQALVFRKEAYAAVVADLQKPGGCWISERVSSAALNISMRMVKQFQIQTDTNPARIDMIYGWKAVRPDLACRISS